jgi:hypothetical protein
MERSTASRMSVIIASTFAGSGFEIPKSNSVWRSSGMFSMRFMLPQLVGGL